MLSTQIIWLFILAIPIACIAWTVTHEEIFAEPRMYCTRQSRENKRLLLRKWFYLFTCEYCFSHYVTVFFLVITRYTLLLPGWRGYLVAGFALVWIANFYMSLFNLLRQSIKEEKTKITLEEKEIARKDTRLPEDRLTNRKPSLLSPSSLKKTDHWKDI